MTLTYPQPLQPGDTIAIVCPAGFMPAENAAACIRTLKKWGYKVIKGKTVGGKSRNYFSGSDAERLSDLQHMLDNPAVKAILFGRGGYGTTRILDQIDWKRFLKKPKWIIGFSDITVLHGYMHQQLQVASIHGPMSGAFNEDNGINRYTLSLKDALEGKPVQFMSKPHPLNHQGKVRGTMIGGNLCLLAHSIGTNAAYDTRGKILFLEDIGEQLYNIDRMMLQLKRAGKLDKLKGLIIGGFSDCKDTERPFGKSAYDIISEHVREYHYPKAFGFPISHEKENLAVIIGQQYTLEISSEATVLHH